MKDAHGRPGNRPRLAAARGMRRTCAWVMAGALWLGPGALHAQPPPASSAARPLELRASISPQAALLFQQARLRRLLAIELQNSARLSDSTAGPLADNVAWVWVDQPGKGEVIIEARLAGGAAARRTLLLGGMASDAAARHVAIAAAELIRSLSQPSRVRKPPAGKSPCCEQAEALARAMPAWVLDAQLSSAWLTGAPALLVGPSLGMSLRLRRTEAKLAAGWFVGGTDSGAVRWAELGMGLEHRWPLHPSWRWYVGGLASAAAVQLGGVAAVDAVAGARDSWSARVVGVLGVETRAGDSSWLSVSVQPGAVLRPVPFELPAGGSGRLSGAWLGLQVGLHLGH